MYVKEINEVKKQFEDLKAAGYIKQWALPYENLLTRLSAAIFFFTPAGDEPDTLARITDELGVHDHFSFRSNKERKLSDLLYSVTFSLEEKEKNLVTI